jgi:hypothetical protein
MGNHLDTSRPGTQDEESLESGNVDSTGQVD